MILNGILGTLALLSLALTVWQWLAARRFPLHQRVADKSFAPAVTLLKPLKGCDETTADCLRSWFAQDYAGQVQVLFAVARADDPVCELTRKLMADFPGRDAQLVVCSDRLGANAKVSKLVELERLAKHEILVISDADVRVPADFLANAVSPLAPDPVAADVHSRTLGSDEVSADSRRRLQSVGLVNCFYRLANPTTLAMRWEAVAINADFWSQVLQSQDLKPLDFALGAVMVTRRKQLEEIGGFKALVDCLADDYQLGNRIARRGHRIAICPVVVECWSAPMDWGTVWRHQLRWARTVRVCQPAPYFFSILSNATIWPLVWLAANPSLKVLGVMALCIAPRVLTALDLQGRLTKNRCRWADWWLVPVKDLLQAVLWLLAFAGNRIEWRGERFRLRPNGILVKN